MFSGSLTSAEDVGKIQVDTKGKEYRPSVNGSLHFLTIIEKVSRSTMTYPIVNEVDGFELLLNFIIRFDEQSGHITKAMNGDNVT